MFETSFVLLFLNEICAGSGLPPASLQLLVPPVRLMSAFIWRLVQHNRVLQYDKVLDFITLTTSIVPELLSPCQRAHLTMDLRARVRPQSSLFVTLCNRSFAYHYYYFIFISFFQLNKLHLCFSALIF